MATPRVAGHDLGPAGEPRHAGERRLLRQVGGQLEVGVEAGLDPAIGLEQQPLAEDHRRVRLVAAERSLIGRGDGSGRGVVPQVGEAGRRPADQRRRRSRGARRRAASPRGSGRPRSPRPAPATSPSPSTASRNAAAATRRTRIAYRSGAASPTRDVDERERRVVDERERVREPRRGRDEPFATNQRRAAMSSRSRSRTAAATAARPIVTTPPGPSDGRGPGSGRQMPVLIVMCLTVV